MMFVLLSYTMTQQRLNAIIIILYPSPCSLYRDLWSRWALLFLPQAPKAGAGFFLSREQEQQTRIISQAHA